MKANIGYAPWEVFHAGLAKVTGLTFGVVAMIVGVVIGILVTALGEKLGLGTLASMILTGVFVDVIFWIDIIPPSKNLPVGIAMLVAGLFIISAGSYFYMKSGFGTGPRDNLMVVLTRKTKIPVGICRGAVELLATLLGWLLGGMVGIGTAISVLAVGFCIQLTFRLFRFDVTSVSHETLRETFTVLVRKRDKDLESCKGCNRDDSKG
ncbi:MAG: hypothetical protein FWF05_00715 [Oscillospiraceae bacterium]|nr:hypothetical protein [Oscillospiraceae bacterium]